MAEFARFFIPAISSLLMFSCVSVSTASASTTSTSSSSSRGVSSSSSRGVSSSSSSFTGRQSGSSGYSSYSPYTADLYTAASGGSYGYGYKKCDCTKYDILGVVAGGAALAALGIYLLLQQAAAARSLSGWTSQLPPLLLEALKVVMPQQDVAGKAVRMTCRVSRMLEDGELSWSRTYGIGARSGVSIIKAPMNLVKSGFNVF